VSRSVDERPARADTSSGSEPAAGVPARAKRADARRNHDLLVATAAELFDERGIEAPLEEIARRAHVGIGTLYRHFATRDAVIEAVYRLEVEMLCSGVDDLLTEFDADTALANWMRSFAVYVARKRGMAMALKSVLGADSELFAESHQRITRAIETLVNAAVAAGAIRSDVEPGDLLRAMGGICMATDSPGWTDRTGRLVDLLMDGLRYGAPRSA
jgi:AcrR family transcriptional regulator